jgi:hypothetical protein
VGWAKARPSHGSAIAQARAPCPRGPSGPTASPRRARLIPRKNISEYARLCAPYGGLEPNGNSRAHARSRILSFFPKRYRGKWSRSVPVTRMTHAFSGCAVE